MLGINMPGSGICKASWPGEMHRLVCKVYTGGEVEHFQAIEA